MDSGNLRHNCERGELVRLLYRLGRQHASGVLTIRVQPGGEVAPVRGEAATSRDDSGAIRDAFGRLRDESGRVTRGTTYVGRNPLLSREESAPRGNTFIGRNPLLGREIPGFPSKPEVTNVGRLDPTRHVMPGGQTNGDVFGVRPMPRGQTNNDASGVRPMPRGQMNGDVSVVRPMPRGQTNGDVSVVRPMPRGQTNSDVSVVRPMPRGQTNGDMSGVRPMPRGQTNGDMSGVRPMPPPPPGSADRASFVRGRTQPPPIPTARGSQPNSRERQSIPTMAEHRGASSDRREAMGGGGDARVDAKFGAVDWHRGVGDEASAAEWHRGVGDEASAAESHRGVGDDASAAGRGTGADWQRGFGDEPSSPGRVSGADWQRGRIIDNGVVDRRDGNGDRRAFGRAPTQAGSSAGHRTDAAPNTRGEVFVLRRGSIVLADGELAKRTMIARLARLVSVERCHITFEGGVNAYPPGATSSLPLAVWARAHLEAQLDNTLAERLQRQLAGMRMSVPAELAPDDSICDEADKRILAAMAQPRRLDQIWPLSRTPRFRMLSFLWFLRAVDALVVEGVVAERSAPQQAPRAIDPRRDAAARMLGLDEDADQEAIKRAYRRLARTLHPDLQPDVSAERRRMLETRFAEVTAAYESLI